MKKEKNYNCKIIDRIEGVIYQMQDIETTKEKIFELTQEYNKNNRFISQRIVKGINDFTIEIFKKKGVEI